jgi:hypothetical protein
MNHLLREVSLMALDKAEWQYDSAKKFYCEKFGKDPEALTEDDEEIIWDYAGNHIAFFITWLIRRDLIGNLHLEDDAEKQDLDAVRNMQKTGMDIFRKYCDMKFTEEDVAESALPFVQKYYEDGYTGDYCDQIGDSKVLTTAFSWSDYLKVESAIDQAYMDFEG